MKAGYPETSRSKVQKQEQNKQQRPWNGWSVERPCCPAHVFMIVGLMAVAALTGRLGPTVPSLLRALLSLALILVPGAALTLLIRPGAEERHPLEGLAVGAAVGLALLSMLGFVGILTALSLTALIHIMMGVHLVLAAALTIMLFRSEARLGPREYRKAAVIILVCAAVMLAFTTLLTPRDTDDWFYLAHIRDYVNDIPINSESAFFDNGQPASPRAWYGGWWVAEAMLSRASGVDPVRFHQVYLPILLLPLAVFALFTFARRIFGSEKIAYLACFLQVVFYVSSAYPSDSAGWAFLCRTAQDKTVACLIMVPAVTALALRLWKRVSTWEWREESRWSWRLWILYAFCLTGSTLVHPMAAVWSGVAIVPFIAIETMRNRKRRTALGFALVLIPFVVSGLILIEGRVATVSTLEGREAGPHEGGGVSSYFDPHFPGSGGRFSAGDRVIALSERMHVGHPLLITRYPLAILGLILTFLLLKYVRQSNAARYLAVLTFTVLALTFVPGLANLTSAVITRKMLYRLTWILPWGLTTAFILKRIARRTIPAWVIAVLLALAVCRGNPANYFASLSATRDSGRTRPELEDVLGALAMEPSPQGVVLGSGQTNLRIPGFVGDAYPVTFRTEGQRSHAEIRDLFQTGPLEGLVREEIEALGVRYVIAEKSMSLGRGFMAGTAWTRPIHSNDAYGLWKIEFPDSVTQPSGD